MLQNLLDPSRPISIFWFRRDLRLKDNTGLYQALQADAPVLPVFIFDRNILDELKPDDPRVTFIFQTLRELKSELESLGSSLLVKYGYPDRIYREFLQHDNIKSVYTNEDYEPYAKERDKTILELLENKQVSFHRFKDHVIFAKDEVLKDNGEPYTVFTPYSRKWKTRLKSGLGPDTPIPSGEIIHADAFRSFPSEELKSNFAKCTPFPDISLSEMGFEKSCLYFPSKTVRQGLIKNYDKTRNFPGINGTSRLGIHFRFGTISIREKARKAAQLNDTYLNELIWRDFYSMILFHFPKVVDQPFREKYKHVEWRNDRNEFERWCNGQTGYPIVDAGMRELNQTGYMHNRVRMITASFLTKHLLIDWRWGETYFAEKLLDFDLASNSGGWQWAAGCGTDAAPYFRVFNPYTQQQKFDKNFEYIKKWVPEFETPNYTKPIVDHKFARIRCLEVYKAGLAKAAV